MAQAKRPVALVRGYFDPYFAEHARMLREIREAHPESTLVVTPEDPVEPLLSRQARAEMLAALRFVDLVLAEGTVEADVVIDLRERDAALCADLRRHVLARSGKLQA